MGEIIIRIDQETGTLIGVGGVGNDTKGKKIEPVLVGNIGNPKDAAAVRKEYDDVNGNFGRFIRLPVELWEKKGNSVCKITVNGQVFKIC